MVPALDFTISSFKHHVSTIVHNALANIRSLSLLMFRFLLLMLDNTCHCVRSNIRQKKINHFPYLHNAKLSHIQSCTHVSRTTFHCRVIEEHLKQWGQVFVTWVSLLEVYLLFAPEGAPKHSASIAWVSGFLGHLVQGQSKYGYYPQWSNIQFHMCAS